ncbi:hypothetical protein ABMA28_016325 [Loxostege sticticalis]|uniref:Uncharacterized protein n=1 Tax=Loxostege sticticalis TaxID=481309 RepID=A0ABD0T8P8_LOXSC
MDMSPERESPISGTLPPMICANLREKILPEEIPTSEIVIKSRKGKSKADILQQVEPVREPVPLHPLSITCSPDKLLFEIKEEAVVQRLWVWNCCIRTIYVHCCEIWGEKAYLGARWRCYPQTRFHLAPGLMAEVFIKASPKEVSPIPCACAQVQLAAAHKRDHVTGFFAVPVYVKFLNHIPYSGEGRGEGE